MIKHPILDDLRRFIKASDLEQIPFDSLSRIKVLDQLEKLPEEDWDSLSDLTKDWESACITAIDAGQLPVDLPPVNLHIPEREGRGSALTSREKNKAIKKKGAHYRVKEIMWEQGVYIEPRKIKKIMDEEGWQVSMGTVQAVKAEFRRSLIFLSEKGWLTSKPKGIK